MDNNYKVYFDSKLQNVAPNNDEDEESLNHLKIEIQGVHISIDKVGSLKESIKKLINYNISNIQLRTNIPSDSEHYVLYLFLKFMYEKRNSAWDIIRFNSTKYLFNFGSVEFIIRNDFKNIYLSLRDPIEPIYSKRSLEEKFILNLDSFNNKFTISKLFQTLINLKYYFTVNEPSFDVFIENFQPPLVICGVNGAGKTRLFNYFNKNHQSLKFFHTRDVIYLKDSMVLSFNENAQKLLGGFIEIYSAHSTLLKYESNGINNNNYIWVQVNSILKKYNLNFELAPLGSSFDNNNNNNNSNSNSNSNSNNSNNSNNNNNYNRLIFKNDKVSLSYEELSSGEKVIFFLISLYLYHKNYVKKDNNNEKRILLLLDEIESPLHARFLQTAFFKIIQEIQSVFVILLSTHNTTSLRVSALYGFNYYSIDRNSENNIIIKKIKSHENAISEVSDGMLAVVDNSKLCFVEDVDDRNFFTMAFKKIVLGQSDKFKNYTKLVFIEASAQRCNIDDLRSINKQVKIINDNLDIIKYDNNNSSDNSNNNNSNSNSSNSNININSNSNSNSNNNNSNSNNSIINKIESSLDKINHIIDKLKSENSAGGCSYVKRRVELLSKRDYLGEAFRLGNSQLIGLIDGDGNNSVFEYIIKLEYYSLEMYFCSPLILYYINNSSNNSNNNNSNQDDISTEDQIKKVIEYLKSREKKVKENESLSKWKSNLDQFYNGLENTVDVQLINGKIVQIPEIFIKGVGDGGGRGHYLFESLVRIYSLGSTLQDSTRLLKDKLYGIFEHQLSIYNIPKTLENSLVELMEYSTRRPYSKDIINQTNNKNHISITNNSNNNHSNNNHSNINNKNQSHINNLNSCNITISNQ